MPKRPTFTPPKFSFPKFDPGKFDPGKLNPGKFSPGLFDIGKLNPANLFKVDEAEVTRILAEVRQSLPTTQAILVGKPQTGKSSIVRALTGVSSDIIGQGYRPHTQHTQRYSFPSDELPLLQFTDTVGLGDGRQETDAVVQELITAIAPSENDPSAKVMILTVKITDFATASLRSIAQQLRQQQPHLPCILAITCLHDRYPTSWDNHPAYPPADAELQRAIAQIEADFAGLYDQVVLIDFTLEEDGSCPKPNPKRSPSCSASVTKPGSISSAAFIARPQGVIFCRFP
jgi:hypothetical protein